MKLTSGVFSRLFRKEKRSVLSNDDAGMLSYFGLTGAAPVATPDNALSISTVYACVRVLAEGVASLPFHTYKKTADGKSVDYTHPTYKLLHSEPNPHMTSFMFRELMLTQVLLHGNFYAWIERDGANRPVAFWPQPNASVTVLKYNNELFYQLQGKEQPIPAYDVIHVAGLGFDGISGKSPIRLQAEQLGITLNAQKYGADFFTNGATLGGILTNKSGTVYTPEQRAQLRTAWNESAHGSQNNHATKILGGGLEYQRIGVPPEEAQFLQTRQLGAVEICGMYRVPPFMVGMTEKSTSWGTGIEQQQIGFVKFTLLPWLKRIEQEFDRKIFRTDEQGKLFSGFNINGLLKGDLAAQTNHIQVMMDRGVYDINMALSFLDQNTIGEAGNRRFVQRNMIPLDRVDDTINQETNKDNGDGKEVL